LFHEPWLGLADVGATPLRNVARVIGIHTTLHSYGPLCTNYKL